MRTLLLYALLATVLLACSKSNQIDGHNIDSFRRSIVSVTEGMKDEERKLFLENLSLLNVEYGGYSSTLDNPSLMYLSYINGKTVAVINNEAKIIKSRQKITSLKEEIYMVSQKSRQIKSNIELVSQKIKQLSESIELADNEEKQRTEDAKKAKEILDRLVVSDVNFIKPSMAKGMPELLSIMDWQIVFKVINGTKYEVDITKVTVNSDYGEVVLEGGMQCKGLGDKLLRISGKIRPNMEREIQCKVRPDSISNTGTIVISGGSVAGVGEYNAETESQRRVQNRAYDMIGSSNKTRLQEFQSELENLKNNLYSQQTGLEIMCVELASLEKGYVLCPP